MTTKAFRKNTKKKDDKNDQAPPRVLFEGEILQKSPAGKGGK